MVCAARFPDRCDLLYKCPFVCSAQGARGELCTCALHRLADGLLQGVVGSCWKFRSTLNPMWDWNVEGEKKQTQKPPHQIRPSLFIWNGSRLKVAKHNRQDIIAFEGLNDDHVIKCNDMSMMCSFSQGKSPSYETPERTKKQNQTFPQKFARVTWC